MKLRIITTTSALFFGACSLFFVACQRERDTDTSEGEETLLFERTGDDIFAIVEQAATGDVSQYRKERSCATITHDTLSTPKMLTVDFGQANCLCFDGKTRRGKVVATYTGKFNAEGTIKTITYNNFYVNDNQLLGVKTVTNTGLNSNNNPTWTVETKDTLKKSSGEGTATWQSTRMREMTGGASTPMWTDDRYELTGSGAGVKANGNNWSMNIVKALKIDHSCLYRITSGSLQFQPQAKALRSMDYGSGACDNEATITINNRVSTVKFK